MRCIALVVTCLVALAQTTAARADVIFSTLAPDGKYWINHYSTIDIDQSLGMQFTSPGDFSVSQISAGLTKRGVGTDSVQLSLWTDSGNTPGVQLGSWVVNNLPSFGTTDSELTTISGITGITLRAGNSYFLVASPGASDTTAAWNDNNKGLFGGIYNIEDQDFTTDMEYGAFEISGTPIPEPATLALLGFGLAGLAAARRRRAG